MALSTSRCDRSGIGRAHKISARLGAYRHDRRSAVMTVVELGPAVSIAASFAAIDAFADRPGLLLVYILLRTKSRLASDLERFQIFLCCNQHCGILSLLALAWSSAA